MNQEKNCSHIASAEVHSDLLTVERSTALVFEAVEERLRALAKVT
jgi:hypothetical protein